MSSRQYLKNHLPVILFNLLGMLALALFLLAAGNPVQSVLFILAVWLTVVILWLAAVYLKRKKYLDGLLAMTEGLKERYLIPEIMEEPEQAEGQVYYQIMKMAEKSMLEKINGIQRERKEYKEYIEQWLHEVKTPITAMKLLCENNRCEFTRDMLAELETTLEGMDLGPLLGLWLQSSVIGLTMQIMGIIIFVLVYGRMIEIYYK